MGQCNDAFDVRVQLLQQVEPLAHNLVRYQGQPGKVATRASQACDQTCADGVRADHDDRNRARRFFHRLRGDGTDGPDHVNLKRHKFGREFGKPLVSSAGGPVFDDDFGMTQLTHRRTKHLEVERRPALGEAPDSRLARCARQWCGVRLNCAAPHCEQAARECACEGSPYHCSITSPVGTRR